MGKKNLIYGLFIILLIYLGIFLSSQKVAASDDSIVINEIYPHPNSGEVEWIELFNKSATDIDLVNYTIEDGTASPKSLTGCSVAAGSYLVLVKGSGVCKFGFALNDDGDVIVLKKNGIEIDKVSYGTQPNNAPIPSQGESIARIPNGYDSDNDSSDFRVQTSPTYGAENPLPPPNVPPTDFNLMTPVNGAELFKGDETEFTWSSSMDPENQEITYDFYLSCNESFSDHKLIDSVISETEYFVETDSIVADYGTCNNYYWKIVASDGSLETSSETYSFSIFATTYSDEVLGLVNLDEAIVRQVRVSQIIDGDTIEVSGLDGFPSKIRLLFVDTPEEDEPFYAEAKDFTNQLLGQSIDLLISHKTGEQIDDPRYNRTLAVIIFNNRVFNTQLLENGLASFYNYDNAVLKKDSWLAILQQAQQARIGLWEAAGHLMLSELLPNPIGDDSSGEWIEIYNPTDRMVNLSRFLIDQYLIPSGMNIGPGNFRVFYRLDTGVVLNNTGDTVRLNFPGGLKINETSYGDSKENQSWALINNLWQWTNQLTPWAANLVSSTNEPNDDDEDATKDIPINSEPIEIKTGEFRNFENYLVTIYGTVISTSGNTFYLDDGSGQAKVYIQEATGIAKPPMHKGDVFEVTGIVNLYRNTWRILPKKQDDIRLIQKAASNSSNSTVIKKASAKAKTTKSPTTSINARSPTKQVASADDVKVAGLRSPWWIQLIKAITGLVIILLILIIVQILRWRKENPRPTDFGDET